MKRRAVLARRVFVEESPADIARDLWKRDGLAFGVRPRVVKKYRRLVSCDGIKHALWFVIAYGAVLPIDKSEHDGTQCRHNSGEHL